MNGLVFMTEATANKPIYCHDMIANIDRGTVIIPYRLQRLSFQ